MPHTRQAAKEIRKAAKRTLRNKFVKTTIQNLVKDSRKLIAAKDAKAEETIKLAIKKIDKASQKGILKKNTAARKKSRLMKGLNKSKKA